MSKDVLTNVYRIGSMYVMYHREYHLFIIYNSSFLTYASKFYSMYHLYSQVIKHTKHLCLFRIRSIGFFFGTFRV